MERYAAEHFDLMPRASLSITGVLTKSDLSVDVIRELSVFEPFGARNEAPVFLLQNARIETAAGAFRRKASASQRPHGRKRSAGSVL